jgi:peptide/nickel transport system permease protein
MTSRSSDPNLLQSGLASARQGVAAVAVSVPAPRRRWLRAVRVIARDKLALVSLLIILAILAAALFPDLIATHSATRPSMARLEPPSLEHFFGTDQFGRDIFSRCVHGARVSVMIGIMTVALAILVGIPIGAVAGFTSPSWFDNSVMRVMDILMAFPSIVLAIAVIAALGTSPIEMGPFTLPHITKLMFVIGLLYVPQVARIVRSSVLVEREEQYVAAEQVLGAGTVRILFRDVLRNCLSPVTVHATLLVAGAIITEASLSFLGLGIQPPLPSWGGSLSDARTYIASGEWWMTLFPGLLIFLTVCALNILGDALRDVLDPKQVTSRTQV